MPPDQRGGELRETGTRQTGGLDWTGSRAILTVQGDDEKRFWTSVSGFPSSPVALTLHDTLMPLGNVASGGTKRSHGQGRSRGSMPERRSCRFTTIRSTLQHDRMAGTRSRRGSQVPKNGAPGRLKLRIGFEEVGSLGGTHERPGAMGRTDVYDQGGRQCFQCRRASWNSDCGANALFQPPSMEMADALA